VIDKLVEDEMEIDVAKTTPMRILGHSSTLQIVIKKTAGECKISKITG